MEHWQILLIKIIGMEPILFQAKPEVRICRAASLLNMAPSVKTDLW